MDRVAVFVKEAEMGAKGEGKMDAIGLQKKERKEETSQEAKARKSLGSGARSSRTPR